MTWSELLPFFAQTGVFGVVAVVAYYLHRDSVRAHDKRATEWKSAYEAATKRADEADRQRNEIIDAVKKIAEGGP